MSNINVCAHHSLSLEDAQNAADELAQDLAEKFAIDYGWDGDSIHFERPGVNGEIHVNGEELQFTANLSFLLIALKPKIEEEIVRYLKEHFGCTFD